MVLRARATSATPHSAVKSVSVVCGCSLSKPQAFRASGPSVGGSKKTATLPSVAARSQGVKGASLFLGKQASVHVRWCRLCHGRNGKTSDLSCLILSLSRLRPRADLPPFPALECADYTCVDLFPINQHVLCEGNVCDDAQCCEDCEEGVFEVCDRSLSKPLEAPGFCLICEGGARAILHFVGHRPLSR